MRNIFFLLIGSLLFANGLAGQHEWPNPSPLRVVSQDIGAQKVTIKYERPSVRGRKIFGGLVPWGEVWRTGAGYCTKLTFSHEVRIGEQVVPAGKYSLFTIPRATEDWTVILNKDTTLYGSGKYQRADDLLRFRVKADTSQRFYEGLSLDLDLAQNDLVLHFNWARQHFSFVIDTDIDEKTLAYIDEGLPQLKANQHSEQAMAAFYLQMTNQRIEDAIEFARFAKTDKSESWAFVMEAELLASTGKTAQAVELIEDVINNPPEGFFHADPKEAAQEVAYLRKKILEIRRMN